MIKGQRDEIKAPPAEFRFSRSCLNKVGQFCHRQLTGSVNTELQNKSVEAVVEKLQAAARAL